MLVEAMATGVPVVASDIDGYRIAARAGRAALLTPPGDVAALAAALERVGSDHATRVRLVAAGRASARRFDVSVVGAQHLKVYERVLALPLTSALTPLPAASPPQRATSGSEIAPPEGELSRSD